MTVRTGIRCAFGAFGFFVAVTAAAPAEAQLAGSPNLRDLLTDFLRTGIVLAPPQEGVDHSAHFIAQGSSQFDALEKLSGSLAREISRVPLSSSAGGFAFEIDPALGIPVRPTESFGPVYAERPYTVGEGKFNLGVSHSRFTFDSIDDINLREGEVELLFSHQDVGVEGELDVLAEGDVIRAALFLKLDTQITNFVGTYGVAPNLDLGLVVPVIDIDVEYSAAAEIDRLSTINEPSTHEFPDGGITQNLSRSGQASGLGDVLLRAKYRFSDRENIQFAGVADIRFPTGDELDLLGTGEWSGRAAFIASLNNPAVSPHLNLGYAQTGGEDGSGEVDYVFGVDWAVDPKLTVAVDFLGRSVLSTTRASLASTDHRYLDPDDQTFIRETSFSVLTEESDYTRNTLDASIGFKINVFGNFLVTTNGLLPLSSGGLRDDFTGLLGFDYSF